MPPERERDWKSKYLKAARPSETVAVPSPGSHRSDAASVAYLFVGPIKHGKGWCTTKCDYDANGVCRRCECLDPERFVVIEYPTKEQDAERQMMERLQAAGIEVRRV